MKVKFENVGRNKLSWTCDIEDVNYEALCDEVIQKKAILSSCIDFSDCRDNTNKESVDGAFGNIIVGGFRQVGTYMVGTAIINS
jgi:hypothetical protein